MRVFVYILSFFVMSQRHQGLSFPTSLSKMEFQEGEGKEEKYYYYYIYLRSKRLVANPRNDLHSRLSRNFPWSSTVVYQNGKGSKVDLVGFFCSTYIFQLKTFLTNYWFAVRNSKKSSWPVLVCGIGDLWRFEWCKIDPGWSGESLELICNQFRIIQVLQRCPIPQTSNWSGIFLAVSYSKPALGWYK